MDVAKSFCDKPLAVRACMIALDRSLSTRAIGAASVTASSFWADIMAVDVLELEPMV